jgi:hypothetical protein
VYPPIDIDDLHAPLDADTLRRFIKIEDTVHARGMEQHLSIIQRQIAVTVSTAPQTEGQIVTPTERQRLLALGFRRHRRHE